MRTGSRRWIAAVIGGYLDGENNLADELESSFTAGILNLADRGFFFSMDRWIRFCVRGAHLAWQVKNGAKSVPFKTLKTLTDGSELVLLRESDSMLGKRRRDVGDKTLPRLPDAIARLVSFTVTARTAAGPGPPRSRCSPPCSTPARSRPARSPPCTPKDGRQKSPTST